MKLKDTGFTAEQIKEKVHKYMIETYERFDFLAETADGMYLYDENGTPYLDFYAGIAVNSAGNCNPKVVAAVKDQLDDIMHTFNYPYTIPQALLAEKVCTTIGMDKIFYQNSGAEANEAMIKMARKYGVEKYGPHKYNIVTAKMGFHGRTFGAMSATGQPDNACQIGFGDMTPGFSYAPYNDLEAFKAACTENTIAIMVEPVQGEGGVHPATKEFLCGLREFCDERGMLLVLDEVQPHRRRHVLYELRHQARHRLHGEGPGRRHAHRRDLRHRGGGQGLHRRLPRFHLRRQPPLLRRGPG